MKEIFKDIPEYEGLYQVSNLGNVKSLSRLVKTHINKYSTKERILKPAFNIYGYKYVVLSKNFIKKNLRVHQLVAMAFLGHKPCGHKLVVNHKDFNKENNNVENLEVVTTRENCNKKHLKSTSIYTGVSRSSRNKNKWISSICINNKKIYIGSYNSEIEAHIAYENYKLSS